MLEKLAGTSFEREQSRHHILTVRRGHTPTDINAHGRLLEVLQSYFNFGSRSFSRNLKCLLRCLCCRCITDLLALAEPGMCECVSPVHQATVWFGPTNMIQKRFETTLPTLVLIKKVTSAHSCLLLKHPHPFVIFSIFSLFGCVVFAV